jgi:hypothetical protein
MKGKTTFSQLISNNPLLIPIDFYLQSTKIFYP